MEKKTIIIICSVIAAAVVAAGLGVLIWWLVRDPEDFVIIDLEGEGIGSVPYTAAFTRIEDAGDMFWWFYPSVASAAAATKPLLLWLDGATGLPPSLLANLGMIGPYDFNLNSRQDTWVNDFNLLFVDAPLGTGFSVPIHETTVPQTLEEQAIHLEHTLYTFLRRNRDYARSPLYIVGQGSGAAIALQLAIQLQNAGFSHNLRGVVLGNGIVSPALALTKLGFYLEEMGYIDYVGREAVETYSSDLSSLVSQGNFASAFDQFLALGDYVNTAGQTVAVNLGHIVEKLTRSPSSRWSRVPDYFGQKEYLRSLYHVDSKEELFSFMDETVAHALGIFHDTGCDDGRLEVMQASRNAFMVPIVDKVEYILDNTDLTVSIYNGNLDAVSNTPGQLEWVDNLNWSGQEEFKNATRQTLVVNRLVEGYFRVTNKLRFYWMNAAGQWAPRDSPAAARRVMQLITGS